MVNPGSLQGSRYSEGPYFPLPSQQVRPRDFKVIGNEGWVEVEDDIFRERQWEILMKTGLLWYNDSKADFASKVQEAAQRYRQKLGRSPDRCHVNPAPLPEKGTISLKGVKVVTSPTIQPNHF